MPPENLSPIPVPGPPAVTFEQLQSRVMEGSISQTELSQYFLQTPPEETSLEPQFWLNPSLVALPPEEATLESALLMNTANAWCYHMRRIAYYRKLSQPGGNKLIRVLAEGDSWFQYPIKLHDTIDHISDRPDVAVRCFSAAGDILSNMVANPQFIEAIRTERPHYFLISGGGNDLVDDRGLRDLLKAYHPSLKPEEYRNDAFTMFKARIARLYRDLFKMVHREDPKLHIICHGYSYPVPNKDRGPWIGRAMEDIGITDRALQYKIMCTVVDDINATLADAAKDPASGLVSYVDVRRVVPAEGWHDEFHPTSDWFGEVAKQISALIVPRATDGAAEAESESFPPAFGGQFGAGLAGMEEAAKQPIINTDYTDRTGFDATFIGPTTPLPQIADINIVSQMKDGSGHVIPYVNFSVVLHAQRRLPLYTASNVDYSPAQKFPEPGRDYTRKGLAGFDGSERGEIWLLDERVPAEHQLEDKFYNKDQGKFDKGHMVRREDVCWGTSYDLVRQANGDTYHSTNCTPQRANFNQAGEAGIWGQLEDYVKAQANTERLSLIAGPVLADDDHPFPGQDSNGPVTIQIPRLFWKIICASNGGQLQTFVFLLEQPVEDLPLAEFEVNAHWKKSTITMKELAVLVPQLTFDQVYFDTDQKKT